MKIVVLFSSPRGQDPVFCHLHLKRQVGPQMPSQLGMMPGAMGGLMLGGMPGLQLPGGLQGVPQLRHPFMGITQQG